MDKELIILEQIQNNPHVSQRDLATIAHASLGMTNAILKRFVEKGLITVKKVNNRNIRYALTPVGIEEVGKRSWSYFKRTIKNVVVYQDAIAEIIKQAVIDGYMGIVLIGESDLAFIVEHECYKQKIQCNHIMNGEELLKGWFFIYAETQGLETREDEGIDCFSLNRLVFG